MDRKPAAAIAPDLIGLILSLVVELLASTSLFSKLELDANWTAAILAGLMAAASYARTKLPIASSTIDKVATWVSAGVVGLAAAGVFARIGLDADGVAHLLGMILAVAAAVRMLRSGKAGAAPLAFLLTQPLLFSTTLACAHAPSALSAARCLVNDPGLDEVARPDYAAKVETARTRLLAGEAEAEDIALLVEAAQISVRLAACVPREAPTP